MHYAIRNKGELYFSNRHEYAPKIISTNTPKTYPLLDTVLWNIVENFFAGIEDILVQIVILTIKIKRVY